MRILPALLAALLLGVLASGCLADEPGTPADTPGETPGAVDPEDRTVPFPFPEDEPTFCASEAGCGFFDDLYHEYVLYEIDTARIDVLVIPPASPNAMRDTETMAAAVRAWDEGIDALAASWLAENLTIRTYVLGQDVPPSEAIEDPEIIVVGAEFNPAVLFGIGLEPEQFLCSTQEGTLWTSPVHEHDGIRVQQAQCVGTGYRCVALNTNFLQGGAIRMLDLVAHEVGHCLGPGHVGDALDFSAKRVPLQDIMSYQHDPEQAHCVSTLNVRVLEGIYAPVVGRDDVEPLLPGQFLAFDPWDYDHVDCANP